jgi:hypothetical protein
LIGRLSLEDEEALVTETRDMLESQADDHPAYAHYLEFWDRRLEQARRRQSTVDGAGISVEQVATVSDTKSDDS